MFGPVPRDKCWTMRFPIILSRIFSASSSRQMGLYAEGVLSSLSGFGRRINLASFHFWGKVPFLRHSVRMLRKGTANSFKESAMALSGIHSGPDVVFRARILLTALASSSSVTSTSFTSSSSAISSSWGCRRFRRCGEGGAGKTTYLALSPEEGGLGTLSLETSTLSPC